MGQFHPNKPGTVVDIASRIDGEELERRRSAVHTVAPTVPTASPSVSELRDRYVILLTAREYAPERLSTRALYAFDCHQKVAMEYGSEDAEEVYADTASGYLMRQRLRELIPDWFED